MNPYKPDIERLQAQSDIPALLEALYHPSAIIRQGAVIALHDLHAREALDALEHLLRYETDETVREQVMKTLIKLGVSHKAFDEVRLYEEVQEETAVQPSSPVKSASEWIQQLHSKNPRDIIRAAQVLGDLNDKLAVEPLIMCFKDASQPIQVRLTVAEALLKLESAPVEVTLLATLRHQDWHIRRNGAAILGQLKAEWAIHPLFKGLSDPHPVVRRTAQAALKHIGTPDARKALAWHAQQVEKMREKQRLDTEDGDIQERPHSSMLDRMNEIRGERQAKSLPPTSILPTLMDDDTQSQPPGARPAPPLDRSVLPDMARPQEQEKAPQTRSIHEERRRKTQQIQQLSDTDRLRHARPTAPLNPDMVEESMQKRREHQDDDETS